VALAPDLAKQRVAGQVGGDVVHEAVGAVQLDEAVADGDAAGPQPIQ
jgi:hypothetical protein